MKRKAITIMSMLFLASMLSMVFHVAPAVTNPLFSDDKILFTSNRHGNYEIYSMNSDGSGVTRLTYHMAADRYPSMSPDGSKIVFASYRFGSEEIYLMNADGTGVVNLSNDPNTDTMPSWSPDGTKIIFATNRDGNAEIYVMNADGSDPTNLSNHPASDIYPSFSPDGTKIVFVSNRDGNPEIYVMNADGSGVTRLTYNNVYDEQPCFSPDGSKIAFASKLFALNYDICLMNVDGSGLIRLTTHPTVDEDPCFSPDGSKILFITTRDGNYEIYVMNVDGTGLTNLTNYPGSDFYASWWGLLPVVSATIDIDPDMLNLKSNGEWVTAYIELPSGYDVNNIAVESILLNGIIFVAADAPVTAGDYDVDGIPDLMVKFNRAQIIDLVGTIDFYSETGKFREVTLTISGTVSGEAFEGSDTVRATV